MRSSLLVLSLAACMIPNQGRADEPPAAPAKAVRFEVIMAEIAGEGAAETEITSERIDELQKNGQLVAVSRIRLTTLDGAAGMVQFGEQAPVRTGRTFSGRGASGQGGAGFSQESISYQNIGTMVQLRPRVEADGSILVELQAEQSRLVPSAANAAPTENVNGSIDAPRTTTINTKTTLRIPPGKTVVVVGRGASTGGDAAGTWILIRAEAE